MNKHKIFSWIATICMVVTFISGFLTDHMLFLHLHKLCGCIAFVLLIAAMGTGYKRKK
ncbi:MAG: hypothetical protein PUF65_08185 [Lachnospiraceae bacterium]|nr:hypothetical protein [Lachnospiraceae bacterium]